MFKTVFYQYKGGKGVTGPPPAKGIKRFLFICHTHFWRLIGLNMLFILFCLPGITIPPAVTAMNRVLLALAREGNVFFLKDFIEEFKNSFIKSWVAFIPWIVVTAIAAAGYISIGDPYENTFQIALFVVACSLLFCYTNYCSCMIALIDLPLNKIIKNAAIMTLTDMRRNVFMIMTIPAVIICAIFYPYSVPLILFFVFSFIGLVNVFIVNGAIEESVIKPENEREAY